MKLTVFISLVFVLCAGFAGISAADPLQGSGSTFAYPLIQKLSRSYQAYLADGTDFVPTDTAIDYEPVGSLGGILRLQNPQIDFAASDFPLTPAELDKGGYAQFPFVAGAIVPVFNVEIPAGGEIRIPAKVLAGIYLGSIQNWNDPALVAANPSVVLPDQKITVLHRVDGSGSTYNWTAYLATASADWNQKYGINSLITWPLGQDVRGSSGMAEAVAATAGSIGYLELGQAQRAGLAIGLVENGKGQFVAASAPSIRAASESATWSADDHFYTSLVNAADEKAYPITAVTYVVMRRDSGFGSNTERVLRFFSFVLRGGSADAEALGYVALPDATINAVKAYWTRQFGFGS